MYFALIRLQNLNQNNQSISERMPFQISEFDLDLDRLPLPLVAALQKLEEETQPFRKVHRLIDAIEVFVKLHTVAVVADVFAVEEVEPEVQGMLAAGLRTPSLGVWWMFAREFAKRAYTGEGRAPLVPGLDATTRKNGALFKLMEGEKNLISFRNGYAHGATPEDPECQADIHRVLPRFLKAIQASSALVDSDWIWTDEKGKSYVARGRSSGGVQAEGLEPNQTYLRHGKRTVNLHPLLVRQEGDRFFFYNDLKKDAANFLNYESALHHRDKNLATHLLERFPIHDWGKQAPEDFAARVEELTETFKGRQDEIGALVSFCSGPSRGLRMIWGGPGIGKSALMARLIQILQWPEDVRTAELGERMPPATDEDPLPQRFHVLEYFIRRGEESAKTEFFLKNMCQRLDRIAKTNVPLGKTTEDLRRNFRERLNAIPEKLGTTERLVLFIDGLDEGTEVDGLFESLPHELPEGIVLLYASRDVPAVRYRIWDYLDRERKSEFKLGGLRQSDVRALLSEVVSKYDIQEAYIDAVTKRSEGNPLYLKLLSKGLQEKDFQLNAIDTLPVEMVDLYRIALERIRQQSSQSMHLLRLLAEARTDVTPETMAHMLESSLDEVKTSILGSIMELLHENELTEEYDDFQLFHESLREYLRAQYRQECEDQQFNWLQFCLEDWNKKRPSGEKMLDEPGLRYAYAHLGDHAAARFVTLKNQQQKSGDVEPSKAFFDVLLALCDNEEYREESFRELGSAAGIQSLCRVLLRQLIHVVPESARPAIGARLLMRFHQEPEVRYQQTLDRLDSAPPSHDIARYARAGQTARDRVLLAVRGATAGGAVVSIDKSLQNDLKEWLEEANDDMLLRWTNAALKTNFQNA